MKGLLRSNLAVGVHSLNTLFLRVACSFMLTMLFLSFQAKAQVSISSTVPAATTPLDVCDGPKKFSVTLTGSATASSNVKLKMTLPLGIRYVVGSAIYTSGYTGNVTETSVAQTNIPEFSVNNVGIGQVVTIEFQAEADCRRINAGVNKNTFNVTYGTANQAAPAHVSDGYNIRYAAFTIATVNPQAFLASVGTTFTRKIYIKNGGAGQVSEFFLDDKMGLGLELVSVSTNAELVGSPIISAANKTYKIRVKDFTTAVNADASLTNNNTKFENNEIVEVIETLRIPACGYSNFDYGSAFKAYVLCFGDECSPMTGTRSNIGGDIDEAVNPIISYKVTDGKEYCRDKPKHHKVVIKNTGSAIAKNVTVFIGEDGGSPSTLQSDLNGGGIVGKVYYFNSFSYKINNAATGTPVTFTQKRSPNALGVCFQSAYPANAISIGKITMSDIAPGDSVTVEFDEIRCTNSEYCLSGEYYKWSVFSQYANTCGDFKTSGATNNFRPQYRQTILKPEPVAPTYINHGETKKYCLIGFQNPWDFALDHNPATAYIEYKLKLPRGVTLLNPTQDFQFLDKNGVLYPMDNIIKDTDSTFRIKFKKSAIPANADFADYKLCANIYYRPEKTVCGEGDVTIETYMNLDPICDHDVYTNSVKLLCKQTYSLMRNCGVVDGCIGMVNREFYPVRTQFGQIDSQKDVRKDWFMQGDTIHVYYKGHVSNPNNATWKYAYTEVQIPNGNDFDAQNVGATVKIYDASSSTWYTCTNPTVTTVTGVSTTSRVIKIDYSTAALSTCLPSSYQFDTGDSVIVESAIHIKKNVESVFENSAFYAAAYTSNVSNPTNPSAQFYCGVIRGKYTYVGWQEAGDQANVTSEGCDATMSCFRRSPITVQSFNFPGEKRMFRVPTALTYNIPTGWAFKHMTIRALPSGDSVFVVGQVQGVKFVAEDLKKYFKGYGGNLNLPEEFEHFQFCVTLQATCATPQEQNYTWGKIEYEMLNPVKTVVTTPVVTGLDLTKNNDATAKTFFAQFDVNTLQKPDTLVTSKTDIATWDIKINNTSPQADGLNAWIAKNTTRSGVKILKLDSLQCYGVPTTYGTPLTADANGIFRLGKIGRNDTKCYRVTGQFVNCPLDSIELISGWNCTAYPISVNDAKFECNQSLKLRKLYVASTPAQVQLIITKQPVPNVKLDLCEAWDYEVKFINSKEGRIKDITIDFGIDPDTEVEVIANSAAIKNPSSSSSATYVNLQNPVKDGGKYKFNISGDPATASTIGTSGLPGVLEGNNEFTLKFRAKSVACGYKSGSSFTFSAQAYDFCAMKLPATDQITNPVKVKGLPPDANSYIVTIREANEIISCSDTESKLTVSAVNNGPTTTKNDEAIDIVVPSGVSVSGIINIKNGALGTPYKVLNQNGGTVYRYRMPANVAIGDSIKFTATLRGTAGLSCELEQAKLKVNTNKEFSATCIDTNNPVVCTILEITGQDTAYVNIKRPTIKLASLVATAKLNPPTGERLKVTVGLKNTSAYTISATDTLVVKLYYDTDKNTVFSAGDELLGDTLVATLIGAGTTEYVTFYQNVAAGKTCPIIAVVDGRGCVCTKGEAYLATVPLDPLPAVTACSGFGISLGVPAVNTYTYQWTATNASDLQYLTSLTTAQPVFNKVNNTSAVEIIKYRVGVNRGYCVEYFAVDVNLNPAGVGPKAGADTAICAPATEIQLRYAGQWSANAGNPAPAIINQSGFVTGMTVNGTYRFTITLPNCGSDEVIVTRKARPNAGNNIVLCSPTSTVDLPKPAAGETWTTYGTNPANVVFTSGYKVSGMNNDGNYKFVLNDIAGCGDSTIVTRTVRPSAGADVKLCGSAVTYKLSNASAGSTWLTIPTKSGSATINGQTGLINNLTDNGDYLFVLSNEGGCSDTVKVTKLAAPNFTLEAISATCSGSTPNNNGQVIITGFDAADKYDFSVGTSYTGTKNFTTSSVLPIDGKVMKNLANSSQAQTFTVRIFNANACFSDKTVILQPKDCPCKQVLCSPYIIKKIAK